MITAVVMAVITAVVTGAVVVVIAVTAVVTGVVRLWLRLRYKHKKKPNPYWIRLEEAATYTPTYIGSTSGVSELNFSVRNGKRWNLTAITT